MPNDQPAQSWGNHALNAKAADLVGQLCAHLRCDLRVLQKQGALEELAAVQAGSQQEVAIEKGASLTEKF